MFSVTYKQILCKYILNFYFRINKIISLNHKNGGE